MPENDSSSLNGKLFPSSYTVLSSLYSRSGTSVKLLLSSDEQLLLPAEKYALLKLREGSELSRKDLLELKRTEAIFRTKQKAVSLLERRPYTRTALFSRLEEALFPAEAIAEVMTELEILGVVDDLKYGENWVLSQLKRKPSGRLLLAQGLRRKGISREKIEQILDTAYPAEAEDDFCAKALEKLVRRKIRDRLKLTAALSRRGFSAPVVRRVIDRFRDEYDLREKR
ncbi:MAG TPA: hypothetical protein ENN69_03685 [Spirochaetia bacterium]|nr:hypothetical protein [Spirochaetia bacterium]